MKLHKLFIAVIAIVSVFTTGCKSQKNKDLIVAKWHMSEITGKGGDKIPDSLKKVMYKEASVEFKKDGKYETIGMGSGTKTGTWQLSADERSLITVEDGSTVTDTVNLVELSAGKMVMSDNKADLKITFKSH